MLIHECLRESPMKRFSILFLSMASVFAVMIGLMACSSPQNPGAANTANPTQSDDAPDQSVEPASDEPMSRPAAPVAKDPFADQACPTPKPIPACDPADTKDLVAAVDIANDVKGFMGKVVRIKDTLLPSTMVCTEMECGPENPCCNSCGGGVGFPALPDIGIDNVQDPGRFSCHSLGCKTCCGIPMDHKELIVTAKVTDQSGFLILAEATVCDPNP